MLVLIVLNGYPGVGKLTIARELGWVYTTRHCSGGASSQSKTDPSRRILPRARVFSNHLLIDAAAALFHRDDPGFMPMRGELVSTAQAGEGHR